jgi:hypothetical protein
MQCGPSGYIQSFALPYCRIFLNEKEHFSLNGQLILSNIRLCLQVVLQKNAEAGMTCEELTGFGFDSHEKCYIKSGFCELHEEDIFKIGWTARKQIFNSLIWELFLKLNIFCFSR